MIQFLVAVAHSAYRAVVVSFGVIVLAVLLICIPERDPKSFVE